MFKHRVGIKTEGWSFEQGAQFTAAVNALIKDGPGQRPALLREVGIEDSDPLRLLLGVPDEWLTEERQRFAEAIYAWAMDVPMLAARNIWTDDPKWVPLNPRAEDARLSECTLDLEFIDAFGMSSKIWGKEILRSPSIMNALDSGRRVSSEAIMRAYVALGAFGFTDPSQFFIRSN